MIAPTQTFPVELVGNAELYDRVVENGILNARSRVWIATANLKDMHVQRARGFRPILSVFDELSRGGVSFRIIHSAMPSRSFQATLEEFPVLTGGGLELQICPRSHWKMVIVDNVFAYLGSANFTGAGLGVKRPHRRNLELGVTSTDPSWVGHLASIFDTFWIGEHCANCGHRTRCPDPIA
ncbi:MAG: phospholipase D-like domain-containing protein [Pseudomonadota bacterium]